MGIAWLAIGIGWLFTLVRGTAGVAEPWRVGLGVIYLVVGVGYLTAWFRGKRRTGSAAAS